MKGDDLQYYLDLERTDIDLEMFAAAFAVEHVTRLIVWGGSSFKRPDWEESLSPHHLEAFLARAVETAQKTGRFEQEWRKLQRIFPRMKIAWEKGQDLFQEDLARATANQEEMEYFAMIDFAGDCYASADARKTYPDDPARQAWVIHGYMLAWRRHFFADQDISS
jgi:hypothetical protein